MNTRKTHLDILRVIACLFVIATHFGFGYSVYQSKTAGSMPYWISLAISISCHFAVPMYFMISGALLLGKEESLTVLYKKRVSRIVITLLIASGIYYVVEKYVLNQPFPIGQIYSGEAYYHLWYLYTKASSYIITMSTANGMNRTFTLTENKLYDAELNIEVELTNEQVRNLKAALGLTD